MDKSDQIHEMVQELTRFVDYQLYNLEACAEALYAAGYRKVGERPRVLTQTQIDEIWADPKRCLPLDLALIQAQYDAIVEPIWGEDA